MKITEDTINHNALRLISDIVGNPFEYMDTGDVPKEDLACAIGAVYGVVQFSNAMKEVLNT